MPHATAVGSCGTARPSYVHRLANMTRTRSYDRLPELASAERPGVLAVVSEPAGIPGVRSEHRSQEDTRTEDDQVADSGWEQAGDHHEAKPEQPRKDEPPPRGSSGKADEVRAQSDAKPGFA